MADISKNKQAVSNEHVTETVPECSLIPPDKDCDILPVELNEDSEFLDEGSSLQELIDSELALRVSGNLNFSVIDDSAKGDQNHTDQAGDDQIDSSRPNFGALDINTQLIMAERKSCFENMNVNGTHFFTVIDEPLEDPDPDLLLDGPTSDSAGETSVVYDSTTVDMNGSSTESHNYETLMNSSTDISSENQQLNLSPADSDILPENDKDVDPDSIIDSSLGGDTEFVVVDDSLLSSPNDNITDNSSTVKDDSSVIQCVMTNGKEPVCYDFFSPLPDDADLEFEGCTTESLGQDQGVELLVDVSGGVFDTNSTENSGFPSASRCEVELTEKSVLQEDSPYPQSAGHVMDKISAELDALQTTSHGGSIMDKISAELEALQPAGHDESIMAKISPELEVLQLASPEDSSMNDVSPDLELPDSIIDKISAELDVLQVVHGESIMDKISAELEVLQPTGHTESIKDKISAELDALKPTSRGESIKDKIFAELEALQPTSYERSIMDTNSSELVDFQPLVDGGPILCNSSTELDSPVDVKINGTSFINNISSELDVLHISEQNNKDAAADIEVHLNGLTADPGLTKEPVHGIVDEVVVCTNMNDNSPSSCSELDSNEMVTSNSTEKKIKKKKKTEGGETVKTKKTKKNKKADSEKENFSVIGMECETLTDLTANTDHSSTINGVDQEHLQDDDLLNVSVKELKETYNNEATKGFNRKACNGLEEIMTGISIEQLKSSFSKFDQLSKKTVLHVRSVDASKVQQQFNQNASSGAEVTNNCRSCSKLVFQMEQVKAEGAVWHKNCFRCKECNKQLNVDNYSSNEGVLYCMPHFKELFKPKAVPEDENEIPRVRRPKMIVCENQPIELPPEVVRASDKPDLGLEELTALNVKSRYQLFEKTEPEANSVERSPSSVSVKRSPSILSKLARFQAKGMDIGVTDESLSNVPYEESSSSSEEEEEDENPEQEGKDVVRANRKQRERPMSFNKMGDIKCKWETGHATKKEERREERKQEIQSIRSRLFMGKQGKMKEMYEQAVQDSERSAQKKDIDIRSEKARTLKEKFERGDVVPDDDDEDSASKQDPHKKSKEEDLSIFEEGISKKSRSLFLELDAKTQQPPLLMSPVKSPQLRDDGKKISLTPQVSKDIVKASDSVEDVKVETSEVLSKFKFFETYKEPEREKKQFRITPPREGQVKEGSPENAIYRDPSVVRCEDKVEDEIVKAKTASKMLSIFRQMEENATKEEVPEGPKPLKRFTPPPDYTKESEDSEDEEDSEEEEEEEEEEDDDDDRETNPNLVRASDKIEDEFLKQATTAARAKALRAKFERWEEKENKLNKTGSGGNLDLDQTDQPSIDSTKSLRAKFESLKNEVNQRKERAPPKVNRFV